MGETRKTVTCAKLTGQENLDDGAKGEDREI